jgi:hypothetical protein
MIQCTARAHKVTEAMAEIHVQSLLESDERHRDSYISELRWLIPAARDYGDQPDS